MFWRNMTSHDEYDNGHLASLVRLFYVVLVMTEIEGQMPILKPIGFWPMTSGTTSLHNNTLKVYDISGNANDGRLKLPSPLKKGVSGVSGTALHIPDHDRIKCSNVHGLDIGLESGEFSYSCFVRDTLGGNSSLLLFSSSSRGLKIKLQERDLIIILSGSQVKDVKCGLLTETWSFVSVRLRQLGNTSKVTCLVNSTKVTVNLPELLPQTSSTSIYHGVALGGELSCVMMFAEWMPDSDVEKLRQDCLRVVSIATWQSPNTKLTHFIGGSFEASDDKVTELIAISRLKCATTCSINALCKSFAYQHKTRMCQLCRYSFHLILSMSTHTKVVIPDIDSVIYT